MILKENDLGNTLYNPRRPIRLSGIPKTKAMSDNETITNSDDRQRIKNQFLIIEQLRDFIIWLCEDECNSTVSEMETKFEEYQKQKQ